MNKRNIGWLFILAVVLALSVACQSATPEPTPTLVIPTAIVPQEAPADGPDQPLPPAATVNVPPPTSTLVPTATPQPEPTATVAPTQPPAAQNGYRVAFVVEDDVLNVRQAAGVGNEVVGAFPPDGDEIEITGIGEPVAGSTWVQVTDGQVTGWVNSRFLTEDVSGTDFCEDSAVLALLTEFKTAVNLQDDALLASLIHPERGLRVHYSWWNPEVLVRGQERASLFHADTEYEWGVEDGSGLPIAGSFAAEILPLLQKDLLGGAEMACNEILAGGTAGLVQLPEGYEAVNYYSFYRPAADESGFDWGTWVVGVEKWNGRYYLSYLVHFNWEI